MSTNEPVREGEHAARTRVVVRSEQLFSHGRELIIKHGEQEYRLRITRADKLILTK
jgi:hemin uptake protein HemP